MVRRIIFVLLLVPSFVIAKDVPKPNSGNRAFVNDFADVMTESQEIELSQRLYQFYDSSSNEIVVLVEKSLEGEPLYDYCNRVGRSWGIGDEEKDNGILIYVAIDDRKTNIQVGYGLEGAVPDFYAKRIIEQMMVPAFKNGDYYGGISKACTRIIELSTGEYTKEDNEIDGIPPWLVIVFILLIITIVISLSKADHRTYSGKRRYIGRRGPYIGGGGGSSFPSGGGGFGGFGGGSFGGGGASGSW